MPSNAPWPSENLLLDVTERRRKPRRTADGAVVFHLAPTASLEVHGQLLDMSSSGFRAVHKCRELCPGQEVVFHHSAARGVASVVWTRITGERVESGFLILQQQEN